MKIFRVFCLFLVVSGAFLSFLGVSRGESGAKILSATCHSGYAYITAEWDGAPTYYDASDVNGVVYLKTIDNSLQSKEFALRPRCNGNCTNNVYFEALIPLEHLPSKHWYVGGWADVNGNISEFSNEPYLLNGCNLYLPSVNK